MNDLVEPMLNVTEQARSTIVEVRANEPDPETLALWVEVSGESAGAFTYTMDFRPIDEAGPTDVVQRHDDLSIVIDGRQRRASSSAPRSTSPAPAW